jgi:hypothetical protein
MPRVNASSARHLLTSIAKAKHVSIALTSKSMIKISRPVSAQRSSIKMQKTSAFPVWSLHFGWKAIRLASLAPRIKSLMKSRIAAFAEKRNPIWTVRINVLNANHPRYGVPLKRYVHHALLDLNSIQPLLSAIAPRQLLI